jgi:hypothetical protein
MTTTAKEVKLHAPTNFHGARELTTKFLQEVEMYMCANVEIYNTEEKKVLFVLLFMNGGVAGSWKQGKTAAYLKARNFGTFDEFKQAVQTALIGSPCCLNSEFAFYMHSEHYLNIATHFRILFHIFAAYCASSQLIRTSEVYFRNFGPILGLQSLFRKLHTSKTCIPTFGYLRTIHPDHTHLP